MAKKHDDLIWKAAGAGRYDFNCWMGKTLKEKNMPKYSSVCLNRFRTFYSTNYSSGREIYIYKWKMAELVTKWNTPTVQKRMGKTTAETLRPFLLRWYALCKKHGMLPKDFRISKKGTRFYIKNTSNLPPSLFYVYITHLRQVWEENHFVYNFVTLVDKYKLNPWSAYVVASHMSIYNSNHHVLSASSRYYGDGNNHSVKMGMMFGMRDYFAAPHKMDRRKMKSMGQSSWGIHGKLSGGIEQGVLITDILDNPKEFNRLLKLPKAEAMKNYNKTLKIKVLFSSLNSLGFRATQDYFEPWWLHLRTDTPNIADELIEKVKDTLDGYIYRKLSYGVELRLNAKEKHLSAVVAKRKRNFEGTSRVLGTSLMKYYVDLTEKG